MGCFQGSLYQQNVATQRHRKWACTVNFWLFSGLTACLSITRRQGGLVFSGLSAWVTTQPPFEDALDYGRRATYICLIISFGGVWGGIIVGSAIMYGTSMTAPVWYREVWIVPPSTDYYFVLTSLNLLDVDVVAVAGCMLPHSTIVPILRYGCFDVLRRHWCVPTVNYKLLVSLSLTRNIP